MMVLSIIYRVSASPRVSANACSTTSHSPDALHRRNCRQTEFQLPSSSGRSRHGAPVRGDPENPIEHPAMVTGRSTALLRSSRQEGLEKRPFIVRHQATNQS
jgi:hypothetical protein